MKANILVADDEQVQRELLGGYLKKRGYNILLASSGTEAKEILNSHQIDLIISDQKMPGMTGIELAGFVKKEFPNVSIIMLTAFGSIEDAVLAMKNGVEDYLTKPVNLEELELVIERILEKLHLEKENEWFKQQMDTVPHSPDIIYDSVSMHEVMSTVARVAKSNATVLVTGESGTGKELVARAVHFLSDRKDNVFVPVNCSAIPENLIESELFGHEKGAFTGADRRRIGRFEQANLGTLFLDEIGDIPLYMQVKLLRVLQEKQFERVGGNETVHTNVRIIAATNRSLEQEVVEGTFRKDLFYRINVIEISIPPLRDRKDDLPVLVSHFISRYSEEHGKQVRSVSNEVMDIFTRYSFPGNVRELGNLIEQAVVLSRTEIITPEDLPKRVTSGVYSHESPAAMQSGLDGLIESLEKEELRKAMEAAEGNKSAAARFLGITERRMRYMLNKYGVDNP